MFFPRLRNHAKWMFVFLALVFGVGFVIFGVGSSLPSGLGDILRNGGSSGGQASVSDAQKAIKKEPKNAQAYHELSQAYQRDGNIDAANGEQCDEGEKNGQGACQTGCTLSIK